MVCYGELVRASYGCRDLSLVRGLHAKLHTVSATADPCNSRFFISTFSSPLVNEAHTFPNVFHDKK